MASKLGNDLPVFINVRKRIGLLLASCLLRNFTQVKVKEVYLRVDFTSLKTLSFSQKNAIVKIDIGFNKAIN